MRSLTKPQLLARIEQLEQELGMANTSLADMQRELHIYQVEQRPSRTVERSSTDFAPTVYLQGKPHAKVTAWEGGRKVTTYKPLNH